MHNHFAFSTKFLPAGGDESWSKEDFVTLNVDMSGRLPTVPPDHHYVLNAKALTFTGQKKIEAMPGEVAEEKVGAVSANFR
jgi:hypothetical protein